MPWWIGLAATPVSPFLAWGTVVVGVVVVGGLTISYFYWKEVYQRALERERYLDAVLRPIQERLRIEEALVKEAALKLAKALARARVIEKCKRIGRRQVLSCPQRSCIFDPNLDECYGGSCELSPDCKCVTFPYWLPSRCFCFDKEVTIAPTEDLRKRL